MWRYPNLPALRLLIDGRDSGVHAFRATSFTARMFGLSGRRPLAAGEGLWINPCASVHTLGMGYPIDLVFLDRAGRVVATRSALAPRRLAGAWHARSALELPPDTLRRLGIGTGTRLTLEAA